jgi:arginyl-tRNA synthetase
MGESFYNPFIPDMLEDLEKRGIITVDKGAKCIFVPKRKVPLMV